MISGRVVGSAMAQLWCQNSQITETEIICWLRVVSVSGHNIAAHSNTFRVAAYSLHHTPPPSDTEQTQLLNMLISPQILSQCVIGNFCTETETAHSRLSLCFCFAGESWTFCSRQLSLISFSHSYDTIMPDDGGMRCQILGPLCQ